MRIYPALCRGCKIPGTANSPTVWCYSHTATELSFLFLAFKLWVHVLPVGWLIFRLAYHWETLGIVAVSSTCCQLVQLSETLVVSEEIREVHRNKRLMGVIPSVQAQRLHRPQTKQSKQFWPKKKLNVPNIPTLWDKILLILTIFDYKPTSCRQNNGKFSCV